MGFELDNVACSVIVSLIAYIVFYALFVAAQLWWAFALVATAFYFFPLLFAFQRRERLISLICFFIHCIATVAIIGWTIFFFVEIFTGDQVDKWLGVYTNGASNRKDVAKYTSIAMSVDGAVTSIVLIVTAGVCYERIRSMYKAKVGDSFPAETLAVSTEIDFPTPVQPIPRLRTTSMGEIRGESLPRGLHGTTSWESQSARFSRPIYTERF